MGGFTRGYRVRVRIYKWIDFFLDSERSDYIHFILEIQNKGHG